MPLPDPFPPECSRRYRPVALIASGGFGAVWEAEHRALGRRVAVKLLKADLVSDPTQLERFTSEARLCASLVDEHIVAVLDHEVEASGPWIAFELVRGPTLREVLGGGPLAWPDAVEVAMQVASALAAAHERRVVHRDVKPENVLRAGERRYKLTDFGIAKWTAGSSVRTETGVVLGTPTYIAPEQIRGEPASPRADPLGAAGSAIGILMPML